MSYSVYQVPQEYSPAYNDNIFDVGGSDNVSEPNFRYVFKVFINGSTTPLIFKKYPHPVYKSAVLNVGREIENFVKHDIDNTVYGIKTCENSIMKYYIEFYEEYMIDGVLTLSEIQFTSDEKKAWNGIIDFINYNGYNQDDYLIDNGCILNHIFPRDVYMNQSGWIYLLNKMNTYKVDNIWIDCYDIDGNLIKGCAFGNPFTDESILENHYLRFDCSPKGLNLIPNEDLFIGSQPIITSDTKHYLIRINTTDGETINTAVDLRFNIIKNCNDTIFTIHYLNNLGAFETFNFTKGSKHTETIKRETYKGVVGGLINAETYGYSNSDASDKVSNTVIKDVYKVRTNWIGEEQLYLLEQLVSSPVVYWDTPNGLIAITIKNSSFEWDRKKIKKMLFLEIEFELSYSRYRQRY